MQWPACDLLVDGPLMDWKLTGSQCCQETPGEKGHSAAGRKMEFGFSLSQPLKKECSIIVGRRDSAQAGAWVINGAIEFLALFLALANLVGPAGIHSVKRGAVQALKKDGGELQCG